MTDKSNNDANRRASISVRRRRASLDEEMEAIFHPSQVREHFSLADLGGGTTGAGQDRSAGTGARYSENDYQSHRTESHHNYHPLHRVHHRHVKSPQRQETAVDNEAVRARSEDALPSPSRESQRSEFLGQKLSANEQLETSSDSCIKETASSNSMSRLIAKSPLKSVLKKYLADMAPVVSSPSLTVSSRTPEAQRQNRSFVKDSIEEEDEDKPSTLQEKMKVKFTIGASDVDVPTKSVESSETGDHHSAIDKPGLSTPRRHSRRSSQLSYKCHDLTLRKHQGSDLESASYSEILEPDEAKDLPSADIDDLASHRFDDPKGIRRHKIRGLRSGFTPDLHPPPEKKKFDHRPHEIFVQLDELLMDDQELVWRETARWIKYEEDVQVSADRWGKPHVAPLSFHSLLNLRYCLEAGCVILDLDECNFDTIIDKIVDGMIDADLLNPRQKAFVVQTLMVRHRHGNVREPHVVMKRSVTGFPNLSECHNDNKNSSAGILKSSKSKTDTSHRSLSISPETTVLIPKEGNDVCPVIVPPMTRSSTQEDALQHATSILRRIPGNSEGSIVLVGALDILEQPSVAFIRLAEGHIIPFLLEVPIPVRFLFILLGPTNYLDMDYHEIGRSISTLMSDTEFHSAAYQARHRNDLLSAINTFLDESVVLPPGDFEKRSLLPLDEIRRKSVQYRKKTPEKAVDEPMKVEVRDPLKRTGKCFGGFIRDVVERFPFYLSDIKDGLNSQCLASTVFIYFASLAGAIAFGGLLEEKTKQLIGVSETLIATCFCGMIFSLLSCQPLVILGTTGPVLMFDEILYQFCKEYGMNFLVVRVWVGIFTAVIATLLVASEVSSLVQFFSRFMQEIYATVISLMFIVESIMKLIRIFNENPLQKDYGVNGTVSDYSNETVVISKLSSPHPNTALLSGILMIGTFYIAYSLRKLRNSVFLFRSARRALGDFGVPIGMALMVSIDFAVSDVYTQKLNVPDGFAPTKPSVRGWFITPWPVSLIELFTAATGGLLIFILLFLETQICELIVGKKERNLKKGSGFHADMMLVSYLTIFCAFMGGPWVCAATVRSISHVSSLTIWSRTHAPGEVAHIVEVKEQRVTNFFVSMLIGLSVLMTPVLRQVPVAVLFGVFLYMGVSSLSGIQLWERFKMLMMPPKHHPDHHPFVRTVTTKKMYAYTIIQIACIAVMWTIKSTVLAPGFPFALIGLVFVHSLVKKLFTPKELSALEGEEEPKEEEPDFYNQIVA